MGTYIIKTPDIGEGIAEVELVAWHVHPGDSVLADQVLADVMTEKATVEVPAPLAGKVLALGAVAGSTVAVGAELVRLEVEGPGNVKASAASGPSLANAALTERSVASTRVNPDAPGLSPAPKPSLTHGADRPIASPALRRRAWELGIDLAMVAASGPAGRIMQRDLDRYLAQHPTPASAPTPAHCAEGVAAEQRIAVIGLRRKIALRMQESKRRIPHFSYVEEVDVTQLEALRQQLNQRWAERRGRLTLLPLLVRALALGIQDFPQINARFDDDAGVITRYRDLDLGIATQTSNGLMVPVLRQAQARDLWANAAEISRLAEAARKGSATRQELSGSTLTLSSLGPLGGIVSTPVINHPEVAIVAVNRMVERPVFYQGAVVVRKMMNLSSSFDHRVIDGEDAARFIQAVRLHLETPAMLFVD